MSTARVPRRRLSESPRSPTPSSTGASRRMRACGPRDTAPERALKSALHRRGFRFETDVKPLVGLNRRVDILFRSPKVAVFVDGCFWHGCSDHGTQAKANAEFWQEKIAKNRGRDIDTTERLTAAGWKVIRVWEHEDAENAAQRITDALTVAIDLSPPP